MTTSAGAGDAADDGDEANMSVETTTKSRNRDGAFMVLPPAPHET
jgi:hypothetical protein